MRNNKQVIRITESDLHNIVNESVRRIIAERVDEGLWDYAKSMFGQSGNKAMQAGKAAGTAVGGAAKTAYNGVSKAVGNAYNSAADAVGNAYNNAKQGVQNMHQNALDASARGDMPKVIQQLQGIQGRIARLLPGNRQASSAIQRVINMLQQAQGGAQ